MKELIAVIMLLCVAAVSTAANQPTVVYDGMVITEDVVWKGTVLVKGFTVVAPQATLRIEPGTTVRFAAATAQSLPGLVIQGRLHASGTAERPVVMIPDRPKPVRGSWGGIVFLSTEKRNLLENCRIEYPETGIDIRYSTVTLKSVSVVQAQTALLSHDGVVQLNGGTFSESGTGVEIHNSELESKETVVSSCQRGFVSYKSAVALSSVKINNNQLTGFEADESRIKISGGEFSGNSLGARIRGGEGQVSMSGFQKNRQTALHLVGARLKIQRCLFADNVQDAVRAEDGGALLLNNAFSSNGGFNLYNAGRETVAARQNWWGTDDPQQIGGKIHDSSDDRNAGAVHVYPWLNEKPALVP